MNFSEMFSWVNPQVYLNTAFVTINYLILVSIYYFATKRNLAKRLLAWTSVYVLYQVVLINLDRFFEVTTLHFLAGLVVSFVLALAVPQCSKPIQTTNEKAITGYHTMFNMIGIVGIAYMPVVVLLEKFAPSPIIPLVFSLSWTGIAFIVTFYPFVLFKFIKISKNIKTTYIILFILTGGMVVFVFWPYVFVRGVCESENQK